MTNEQIPPIRRGVAQSGRVPGLEPEGRRFESCRPDQSSPFKTFEEAAPLSDEQVRWMFDNLPFDRIPGGKLRYDEPS